MVDINFSQIKDILSSDPSFFKNLPPELIAKFSSLITLFKAIGIIFLIYIVFLIIKSILGIRRNIKINKMYDKVNQIDGKLNLLLRKQKINSKEESSSKPNKIKSKFKK